MQKTNSILKKLALFFSWLPFAASVQAEPLKVGQPAPQFQIRVFGKVFP